MRIIVNDESHEIAAATVAAALGELGFADAVVATALNGEFVPIAQRWQTPLAEGDRLDVLAPMQGG